MHERREAGLAGPQGRRPEALDDGTQRGIGGREVVDGREQPRLRERRRDGDHASLNTGSAIGVASAA